MTTTIEVQFQWRRSPAATWTSDNDILGAGEPGMELDTNRWKLGDGSTAWNALAYQGNQPPLIPTTVKTGTYAAVGGDYVLSDATAAPRTVTLPNAPANNTAIGGRNVASPSGTNLVTVTCGGSDTFDDGTTSHTLVPGMGFQAQYQHSTGKWVVVDVSHSLSELQAMFVANLVPTAEQTAPYTASVSDLVLMNAASGSQTITLPNEPADRSRVGFKITAITAPNTVTLQTQGSDVFNRTGGPTSITLSTDNAGEVQYDAALGAWIVVTLSFTATALNNLYDVNGAAAAAVTGLTPAAIGACRVVNFGSNAATSRGGAGGTVIWVGSTGVNPTNTTPGDIVLNAASAVVAPASFVDGGVVNSTTNSQAIVVPADSVVGDVAIVGIGIKGGSPAGFTAPSGWTVVGPVTQSSPSSSAYVAYKTIASGDIGATTTWSYTGSAEEFVIAIAVYGGVAGTPLSVTPTLGSNTTPSTSVPCASITPAATTDLIVGVIVTHASTATGSYVLAAPPGYTLRESSVSTNAVTNMGVGIFDGNGGIGSTAPTGVLDATASVAVDSITALVSVAA